MSRLALNKSSLNARQRALQVAQQGLAQLAVLAVDHGDHDIAAAGGLGLVIQAAVVANGPPVVQPHPGGQQRDNQRIEHLRDKVSGQIGSQQGR